MVQSIVTNRDNLIIVVNKPGFCSGSKPEKRQEVKRIVLNDDFYENLELIIRIIEPINLKLVLSQNNSIPLSNVVDWFTSLFVDYFMDDANNFTEEQQNYILSCINFRWDFISSNAHKIAFLLDPTYIGYYPDLQLDFEIELFEYYSRATYLSTGGPTPQLRGQFEQAYTNYREFIIDQKESNSQ
jgi:hypothetical protein